MQYKFISKGPDLPLSKAVQEFLDQSNETKGEDTQVVSRRKRKTSRNRDTVYMDPRIFSFLKQTAS